MKVSSISATYTRKFNLGDYEALEISETVWASLELGDDPDDALDQIMAMAKNSVYSHAQSTLKNNPFQIEKRRTQNQHG